MNNNILKTELVKWEDLKLFQPSNLKKMSKTQLDKLKTSFKNNGFKSPFYVWEDKNNLWVLDGHHRIPILKLLKDEGEAVPDELPANFVYCKNKKEAKKAVLIYNSHYADIQQDVFADWIKDLDFENLKFEIDIDNIDFEKIEQMLQPETQNDDDVPEDVKTITKIGDLWELGRHRVLCGDSSLEENINKLMSGDKATIIFTDPPYGVAIGNKNKFLNSFQKAGRNLTDIQSDNKKPEDLKNILLPVFIKCRELVASEDCTYFMTAPQGGELGMMMMMMMKEAGLTIRHVLMWYKNSPTFSMGRLDYDYQHEPILMTWLKNHKRPMLGEFKTSVWKIDKPMKSAEHPTMKPVALYENAYLNNSDENDIAYDPFAGSGTAILACEKTNRVCRAIELEPHYCDVIRDRYIKWCKDNNRPYSVQLNGKEWVV